MTRALPLVKKEARAVAPMAAMCVAVVLTAGALGAVGAFLGVLTYLVGSMGLGASIIGHEFSHSTLGVLFVQPVARQRLLAAKCLAAAVALAGVGVAAWSVGLLDGVSQLELVPRFEFQVLVFSTALFIAPWLTMLTRNALAGTVGALASPVVTVFVLSLIGTFRDDDVARFVALGWVMAALSGVAAVWGWWLFTYRLEDLGSSAGQINLRLRREPERADRQGSRAGLLQRHRQLVSKEIRLQQLPLVIAGLYGTACLLAWLTTGSAMADLDPRQEPMVWLFGGATALLIGAVTSAEERQLGTMPWQTILPVSSRQQFMVKSVLAIALSMTLTWGLPGLVVLTLAEPWSPYWLAPYALATMGLTLVGLYVSSMATSGLRAFMASLPVVAGLVAMFMLARAVSRPLGLFAYDIGYPAFGAWFAQLGELSRREVEFPMFLAFGVLSAGLVVMVWRFALANHSTADSGARQGWRQAASVGPLVLIGLLSILSVEAAVSLGPTSRRGVISGIVVDEVGEPVPNVLVRAMQSQYSLGNRFMIVAGRPALTDHRGYFRIDRLASRDYYPVALTGLFASTIAASKATRGFAPTFFPGTADVAAAEAVSVNGRDEVEDLRIGLVAAPMARLAGRLVDEHGQPVVEGDVFLTPAGVNDNMGVYSEVAPDGRFVFDGVPPGTYTVQARGSRSYRRNGPFGRRVVTIDGQDLTDVDIRVSAGAVLRGSVVFEGDALRPGPDRIYVSTQAMLLMSPRSNSGPVQDDWTFELTGLWDRREVRARIYASDGASHYWTVKEIRLDGNDATDVALDFDGEEDIDGLEVVFTDRVGRVAGTVRDWKGQVARRYTVVVFSADSVKWASPSRYLHRVGPTPEGDFRTRALLPGDYLVVALTRGRGSDLDDPEFLNELRPLATPVTLTAGSELELSLQIAR